MKEKMLALLLTAAMLLAVCAGCGSGAASSAAPAQTEESTEAAPETPATEAPAAHADENQPEEASTGEEPEPMSWTTPRPTPTWTLLHIRKCSKA